MKRHKVVRVRSRYVRSEPVKAKEYKLSDADWNSFSLYLKDKEYDYSTKTEDALKALQKNAESEKYFDAIQADYDLIKNKISHDKEHDLQKNKEELVKLLEQEIVSRYYYQNGRIMNALNNDSEILKAIDILNNKELYNSTLTAK